MKLNSQETNQPTSAKLLHKCTSTPSITDTNHSSSNTLRTIDCMDEEYRKYAIKWILSYNKKVTRDTQYLAISYLNRLNPQALAINEQNYQIVGLTLLLLACKINEIYPPKIIAMATKCKKETSDQDIIDLEGIILTALNFDMAIQNNAYTYMSSILGSAYAHKLEECEKLLRMVAPNRQIYQLGQEILAYAIIYLIIPDFIRKMKHKQTPKIKTLAIKIYSIYTQAKEKYDRQKENKPK